MIIGTVAINDSVERSSAEADSASMDLYLAASKTTIVASGKLQQTNASRANGLCTEPTVPALVSPCKGWSTAIPKTGVADVASRRA